MTDASTFGNAVRWNFIGSAARVVLTLCCQLTLLRLLGPESAGKFAIFLSIVGLGSILSEGGMMAVLTRASVLHRDLVRNALFVIVCYSAIVAVILLALTVPIMSLFHLRQSEIYIPLAAIANIIPLGVSSVPLSMLRRSYRSRDVQIIQTGAYALGFAAVAVPLAFIHPSASILVIAFTVQTIATLVAGFVVARCPLTPKVRGAASVQSTSWRALTSNVFFYFSENAATVLTAHNIGAHALGIYSTALNLLRMPTDVLVTTLHAPLLVSAAQDNNAGSTRIRFLTTLNILSSIVFPVFFIVFFTGSHLIVPLLGSKWIEAGPALSIVGLVMMGRLLSMLSGAVVWGHGRLLGDSAAQFSAVTVTIAGFLILRPASAEGVVWLVFASVALKTIIQFRIAVGACAITFGMLWRSLVAPTLLSMIIILPISWITNSLPLQLGLASFLLLGATTTMLLLTRILLGLWLTPDAWTTGLRGKVRQLLRRAETHPVARPMDPCTPTRPTTSRRETS